MYMGKLAESDFEETTIERLEQLDYEYRHGQELYQNGERERNQEVALHGRLEAFLQRTYPMIPYEELSRLVSRFVLNEGIGWEDRNFFFHQQMTKGIEFDYEVDGEERFQHVYPINWNEPEENDFLVVNQLSIKGRDSRRPDMIVYINGLPMVVFELKNPNDENATVHDAYTQIRNYTHDISQLFEYNAFTVVSDGIETKHGMPSADYDFFASWKTINGVDVDNNLANTMRTLVEGLFPKDRLLNYIRNFILFLDKGDRYIKVGAKYHQFFGVNFAVEETVRATSPDGDRKIGVMYHTTGSGKSISMLFYSAILSKHHELDNPTIVVQVDRTDLDEQLHDTFSEGYSLIGHIHHAKKSDELRDILKAEGGQIAFSTIEKFRLKEGEAKHPVLSERSNIIVISDEAHRTQSGFDGGYAAQLRHALPNASFVGFTGTPVKLLGNNTEEIFGHVIHRYDMAQAVQDKAVLPLYYESRMIPLDYDGADIDREFSNLVSDVGLEDEESNNYKVKWAALEKVVGTQKRLSKLSDSVLDHFNKAADPYQKGMIVCMSRDIAVKLYNEMNKRDDCPEVEVIMTGNISKDPESWRQVNPGSKYAHIKTKEEQEEVKARLKDTEDPLKLVIVVSMWLTGFDAPNLSFLYVDKPMKGHNLIQAIARVNRVFPGKEGGLIVDFIGIATSLKEATNQYTGDNATNDMDIDVSKAIEVFHDKLNAVRQLVGDVSHKDDWRKLSKIERENYIGDLVNDQLNKDPESFVEACVNLEKAHKLIRHLNEILPYSDEVTLYQMVRIQIRKYLVSTSNKREKNETVEERLNNMIDEHLESKEPVDIYQVAGIEKPDISILDESFLNDLEEKQEHEDLRIKLLKKLLEDHIKVNFKPNSPKEKEMKELLEKTLHDYHNRIIQAADVVRMMVDMKKEVDQEIDFRKELGLSDDEAEFYKAITAQEMDAFDNEFLADLVHKVVKELKKNLSQDWLSDHRKNIYAKVSIAVKKVLMDEGIKGQQMMFLSKAIMKQAEEQYKDWPREA
ncbi:type I restriction endonuclease subunit R [Aquisalibacillus elongatus]|uniref:Type I restriction enzyme endonuclease subunit n=1 Tax=Aquisalibacillus elongatus TaxID=485577 RepID=A0A3N5CDI6_9BACI|nr:type I restriction endonuclease subunit R [Aquisalibacillus elongatus]RPF57025.1 type I restriction enzyme R subunit [Aquisalibacillus elongatus]